MARLVTVAILALVDSALATNATHPAPVDDGHTASAARRLQSTPAPPPPAPPAKKVDCVEVTKPRSTCVSLDQELYRVIIPATGGGKPCTGKSTRCTFGDGALPKGIGFHGDNAAKHTSTDVCYCPNGTPMNGTICHRVGGLPPLGCQSCNKGFSPDSNFTKCVKNPDPICQCPGGFPANLTAVRPGDPICKRDKAVLCTGCTTGYFLARDKTCVKWNICGKNEYQTVRPNAFRDRVCGSHKTCSATQYVIQAATSVSDNRCSGAGTCANGALMAMRLRTTVNQCGKCNYGYHLKLAGYVDGHPVLTCRPNQCSCRMGKGAFEKACPKHQQMKCISCKRGYEVKKQTSGFYDCQKKQNQCRCPNGVAPVGKVCRLDGAFQCIKCSPGYILTADKLKCKWIPMAKQPCTCKHGKPPAGSLCTKTKPEACFTCKPGYVLGPFMGSCLSMCECALCSIEQHHRYMAMAKKDKTHACGQCNWEQHWLYDSHGVDAPIMCKGQ